MERVAATPYKLGDTVETPVMSGNLKRGMRDETVPRQPSNQREVEFSVGIIVWHVDKDGIVWRALTVSRSNSSLRDLTARFHARSTSAKGLLFGAAHAACVP
jgi:hypothetical protein